MLLTSMNFTLPAEGCATGCSVTRTAVGVFVSIEALDSPRNSTSRAILMVARAFFLPYMQRAANNIGNVSNLLVNHRHCQSVSFSKVFGDLLESIHHTYSMYEYIFSVQFCIFILIYELLQQHIREAKKAKILSKERSSPQPCPPSTNSPATSKDTSCEEFGYMLGVIYICLDICVSWILTKEESTQPTQSCSSKGKVQV